MTTEPSLSLEGVINGGPVNNTTMDCWTSDGQNSSTNNCTPPVINVTQLLQEALGHRYRNSAESAVLTIVYCAIFLTGLVGNVCTCVVIVRNLHMHTTTNYYLFTLAISDVLTLVLGLPPELYTIWEAYPWRFGEPYCLLKTFLTEMTSSVSCLTITAFTLERYVAICHPLRAQAMSSLHRAVKTIVFIWIVSAAAALPYPIHTRSFYYINHPGTHEPIADSLICNIEMRWLPKMRYVFQLTTFMLFVLPMAVITALYIRIGLALRKAGNDRQLSTMSAGQGSPKRRRPIIKMLGAVVVAFFICWAPFHAQRLMTAYVKNWTASLLEIQSTLFYISGVLYFVSSTVNPILYNLMSKKYREAFKETLCRCCLPPEKRRKRDSRGRYILERSMTCYTVTSVNSGKSVRERELIGLIRKQAPARMSSLSDSSHDSRLRTLASEQRLLANDGNGSDSINGNGNIVNYKNRTNSMPLSGHENGKIELAQLERTNDRAT